MAELPVFPVVPNPAVVSNDPVTVRNLPFDDAGNLIDSRSRPRGAGVGAANNYQTPRRVQFHIRFSF